MSLIKRSARKINLPPTPGAGAAHASAAVHGAAATSRQASPPLLRIQLVGPMHAVHDGRDVLPRGRKARALLAYLCMSGGERVPRLRLSALLWDRMTDELGRTNLRQALRELTSALGDDIRHVLRNDRDHLSIDMSVCAVDIAGIVEARAQALPDEESEILRLCSGRLLDELDGTSASFDQWLASERSRFEDGLRRLCEKELQRLTARGAAPGAQIAAARRLVTLTPDDEQATRVLMHAYLELGDRAQAIREYERCKEALRESLDIGPSKQTLALHDAIKNFTPPPQERAYAGPAADPAASGRAAPARPATQAGVTVAVLPFREHDVPAGDHYFASGLVEEVIAALTHARELLVISYESILRYRDMPLDLRAIGEELGVKYIVTGRVRRARSRLLISAELTDAATALVLWSGRVEGGIEDVFDLQDKLATRVVGELSPQIQYAELKKAMRKRPDNLDVYDLTLRGLDLLYRLEREQFDQAADFLHRAIAADRTYATPHALLAQWHGIRIGQGWSPAKGDDLGRIAEHAEKALALDPLDPRALSLWGHLRALRFNDHEGALLLFERAMTTSPGAAIVWVRSSPTFSYLGDGREALRRAEVGLRLSPVDPHLFFSLSVLALAHYVLGDYASAEAAAAKSASLNPAFTANLRILAAAQSGAGRVREARETGRRIREIEPGFRIGSFIGGYAYRDKARRDAFANHLLRAGLPK